MSINKQTTKGRVIMNKIYGFKENRIKDFGEYLKRTENTKSLTKIFSDYSATSGMSKGTVRNMYYALARACKKDRDLKKTYWGEKEIKVNNPKDLYKTIFEYIWNLPSLMTIFQLQDLIKLDNRGRINWPGTVGDPNWCFKFRDFSWKKKVQFFNK